MTGGGFRLHEADAHLAYARLHLAEGKPEEARGHLEAARRLVGETGYHRRDGELAEVEADCAREEEKKRRDAETQRRKKAQRDESENSVSSLRASAPPRLRVPSPDPGMTSPPHSPAPSIAMSSVPAMTPAQLLDALGQMLPAQFEELLHRMAVPTGYISAATAAQTIRATEVLRWAEQAGALADLARAVAEIRGRRGGRDETRRPP